MKLIRRPWVWLSRVRHRRGYGVHSPSAFAFITDVVYERTPFYAYAQLLPLHPWWQRYLYRFPITCRRFLFRLANYAHPATILLLGERPVERAYLSAACPAATMMNASSHTAASQSPVLLFAAAERLDEASALLAALPRGSTLVCEGIYERPEARAAWEAIRTHARATRTFDLYTYGVALLDLTLTPDHYIVDF